MKKIIISLMLLVSAMTYAQKGTHEASLDIADGLVMRTLEVNYEFYLTDRSTVGTSALINFAKRSADFKYNEKTMFTPFFRHYFTDDKSWNYFGEVFTGINSGEKEYDSEDKKLYKDYTDLALGVSAGLKYISDGGFVIHALAGIGRNMFTEDSPVVVPRGGVSVGYRF